MELQYEFDGAIKYFVLGLGCFAWPVHGLAKLSRHPLRGRPEERAATESWTSALGNPAIGHGYSYICFLMSKKKILYTGGLDSVHGIYFPVHVGL